MSESAQAPPATDTLPPSMAACCDLLTCDVKWEPSIEQCCIFYSQLLIVTEATAQFINQSKNIKNIIYSTTVN